MSDYYEDQFEHLTIEREDDCYIVVGHGEYPESSVLAGMPRRSVLDCFRTEEEARWVFPRAQPLEHSTRIAPRIPSVPWEGFDEADAGERWDEDY